MASNLTGQVRSIAQVTTAVANGDLTQQDHRRRARRDRRAEGHDQHDGRPALVVRRRGHARGARGRHRGPARRPGRRRGRLRHVARPDRERQLHGLQPDRPGAQHRAGRDVRWPTATSRRRSPCEARGEILQLKDTLNTMVDQLSSFADEVTRVAREVGTEGKLGGQAEVEGVSGTWRGLTESVNQLAVEPHDAGARDRRRVHRRDPGRPHAAASPSRPRARSPSSRTASTR